MCMPTYDGDVAYESAGRKRPAAVEPPRRAVAVDDNEDDTPRVTFQADQVHLVVTALSCLEDVQDRHQLWYNRDDIKGFRRTAQTITKQLRKGTRTTDGDEDTCTRGYELRMSLQRQDRKQLVVKRILEAQDEDSASPEELAQIAQEHSIWSRKLAVAQAHKDYYAAYHPTLASAVLPPMPAMLDCHKDVLVTKKRSLFGSSLTQTGRRVRCRMY